MTVNQEKITAGKVVTFAYVLKLDDGEEIDSATATDPLAYLHGQKQIIRGLEEALEGMEAGQSKKISLAPVDAYGDYDPDGLSELPLEAFPDDFEVAEGIPIQLEDSSSGRVVEAIISDVDEDVVVVNTNHPLAGETLHFDVEIVNVRAATADERSHGHAHGPGGVH